MVENIAELQPVLFLGLNTNIPNNIHHLTDEDIIYPIGSVVTVHNNDIKKQRYIRLPNQGKNLTQIVLSPDRKIIALSEQAGDSNHLPTISLWCPQSYRKKRTIQLPNDQDIIATKFVSMDFTFDSKSLICVTNEPDWSLYAFKCERGRLWSRGKAVSALTPGTITQIACNPNDPTQVAVIGEHQLRVLTYTDQTWRQFGSCKADKIILTSCVWLTQDRLLVGSNMGKLIILENGELKAVFDADNLPIIELKSTDELKQTSETSIKSASDHTLSRYHPDESYEIRSLCVYSTGFMFGYLNGKVHIYEKDSINRYVKKCVIKINPEPKLVYEEQLEAQRATAINSISISPSNEVILVTCSLQQIYTAKMKWIEMNTETTFLEFGPSLHKGPVGDMAVCYWKSFLITSGSFPTPIFKIKPENIQILKLWNYDTQELILQQRFEDDIYGIDMHPTGLYAVAGFTDKLRYMMIMIDEFQITWEFPIRGCKMMKFSNLGHLFGAANGNIIQIYSCITFNIMYILKGHSQKIEDMSWNESDLILYSCDSGGAAYEWNVEEQIRSNEVILKSSPFNGIKSAPKGCYGIGIDGHLRYLLNSNIIRDVVIAIKEAKLTGLVLSRLDTMLFVANNFGTIYSIQLPLLEKASMLEFTLHASKIKKLCISYDDRFIFSCSEDGNLCFWRVTNADEKIIKFDKEFDATNEILISRPILEQYIKYISELQTRVKELQTEHSYQLRQIELQNETKAKQIHSGYISAIEEMKRKNEMGELEHLQEIDNLKATISDLKIEHDENMQKQEHNYNEKLIIEYGKCQHLEEIIKKLRNDYEKQLTDLRQAKKDSEKEITDDFLNKLREKDVHIDELIEERNKLTTEHESIKEQIEEDADREIYDLKCEHEKRLKEERDINVRLRGEASVIQKKLLLSQKQLDKANHHIQGLENEELKLKSFITTLEKDNEELKKEIEERDLTITEKEKNIYQLKCKNQELEKYKFLQEFKIKELKDETEPRERTILDQKETINEMVKELENLQKLIITLNLRIDELREKLNSSEHELHKEIEKNRQLQHCLRTMRIDIHRASGLIQNVPLLTKTIREMYHRYNEDKNFMSSQAEDTEAIGEFQRQRQFLERTVATLKRQTVKDTDALSSDKRKLVDQNAKLLAEINMLRKKLKEQSVINKRYETFFGISGKDAVLPKVDQQKIELALANREETVQEFQKQINEKDKFIDALVEENVRLVQRMTNCDQKNTEDNL